MTYPGIDLGPLPVSLINATLKTDLEAGQVRLSSTAHRHMAEDHAADYAICIRHLRVAIGNPTFIGQAPGHARNFEMIKRVGLADGRSVLVAIGLDQDACGDYRVRSAYLLRPDKIEARRLAGRLHVVPRI